MLSGEHFTRLCERCSSMNVLRPLFTIHDVTSGLRTRSKACDLCNLLYYYFLRSRKRNQEEVHFFRVGSTLVMGDNEPPVLTLVTPPGKFSYLTHINNNTSNIIIHLGRKSPYRVSVGLHQLPQYDSEVRFRLLRDWITDCNNDHKCREICYNFSPTRLIDVGHSQKDSMRLVTETTPEHSRYIALSHRWGETDGTRLFWTLTSNIEKFKEHISFETLPYTFQDAVTTTRALGVQYLWIDCLCIIQDDSYDWHIESQRMEHIFSSAYCTIAATCATSVTDGFLKPRAQRRYATLRTSDGQPLYMCEAIDDFRRDVEEGHLNQRGWVLQERVLSTRTLYFGERQVY